ncbi:MAG: 4-hydroxy-tetrahydrodipicolinate reductase [Ruminococcaceae bacterium]|nr:4-hydroxy-tetrahydrodipicolinate reductase [Oscillospiraceae bacterium]
MNILICGIGGRMGHEVAKLALEGYRGAVPMGGVDIHAVDGFDFPVYQGIDAVPTDTAIDCIIDFTFHTGTPALLDFAVSRHIPTVIATTGHTPEELEAIKEAAKSIPVFHAANMSLGIALLCELAKTTVKAFPDADIEIVETHHNRKLDAPSGTALALADAIRTVREKAFYVFGRHGHAGRTPDEIGIHALRMGNVVGEHKVIVATDSQTITLEHQAHSRALFAEGALAAAAYLVGQPSGLYDMQAMIAN